MLSMGGVLPPRQNKTDSKPSRISQNLSDIKRTVVSQNKPAPAQSRKTPKKKRRLGLKKPLVKLKNNIFYISAFVFIIGLYVFDINKFPPVTSGPSNIYQVPSDIDSVAFLPVKVVLISLNKLHLGGQLNARYISVAIMLISLGFFYKFISNWLSRRMSVIAALLFACSSWSLFQTRQDTVTTMMLALVPAILYVGGLAISTNSRIAKVLAGTILAQFIFVPGAIWFFILPALMAFIYQKETFSFRSLYLPFAAFLAMIAGYIALIIHWSLDSYPQLLRLIGMEVGNLPTLGVLKVNATDLPSQLFLKGINDSSVWLKETPIIDWVSVIFLLLGFIYLYKTKLYPIGKKVLWTFLILSALLILANGVTYVSVILPLLYILIALGITYLTDQWMIIFPSNPLARSFGLVVVGLVIFVVCTFHVERYFIGWPKTDEYHQIYKN